MSDRSKDVSEALTEIRTVRSRAQSALERLAQNDGELERLTIPASMDDEGYIPGRTERFRDPDADEMVRLLTEFVDKTECFAKGRRTAAHRPGRF